MKKETKYTYKKIKVSTGLLIIDERTFNPTQGSRSNAFKNYQSEVKHFGYLDLPICLKQINSNKYTVLSNIQDVEVARANGLEEIEIVEILGLHPNDAMRLMIHRSTFLEMNKSDQYKTIKWLKRNLTKTSSGKQWAKEIDGQKTDHKMATVLGRSASTINLIVSIGDSKNGREKLQELDNDTGSMREMYGEIQFSKKTQVEQKRINIKTLDTVKKNVITEENLSKIKAYKFSTDNGYVFNSDCIGEEGMRLIEDKSIGMILTDLPYGILKNQSWDITIPFIPLWKQFLRVIKDDGAIVLTAAQPFTTALINSNIGNFKEHLVWNKVAISNQQNAKTRHGKQHEDICIFSPGTYEFHPQGKTDIEKSKQRQAGGNFSRNENLGHINRKGDYTPTQTNHPKSILVFPREKKTHHATQKPVALFEYLIKSYSREGETILDACLGSGTTCIAAMNTNRSYVGFENKFIFFNKIIRRIKKTEQALKKGGLDIKN